MEDWLIIYRGYTSAELADEITWLRTQVRNPFNAQTEGSRSYARSTAEMRDRLSAATQVTAENAQVNTFVRHGTADFSGV